MRKTAYLLVFVIVALVLASCSSPEPTFYSVHFETNGGDPIDPYVFQEGSQVTWLPQAHWTGHEFLGWYEDPELTRPFDVQTVMTGDITVYAKWESCTYEVVFVFSNGSDDVVKEYKYGELVERPEDPVKTGYVFEGWFVDGAEMYDFDAPVERDLELRAEWREKDPIFVYLYISSIHISDEVLYGTEGLPLTRPEDPFREGYEFVDWYIDGDFSEVYDFEKPLSESIRLYAKFNPLSYSVSFETNGGSEIPSMTATNGEVLDVADPERKGYTFSGWYYDEGLTQEYDPDTTTFTEAFTLYAKWEPCKLTITFMSKGYLHETVEAYSGEAIERPDDPTWKGSKFTGWYLDEDCTKAFDFSTLLYEDLTLYAGWAQIYPITFDSFEFPSTLDSSVCSIDFPIGISAATGDIVEMPQATITIGDNVIQVKEWYQEGSETPFDFSKPIVIDRPLVLYARWEGYEIKDGVYEVGNEYGLKVWWDAVAEDPSVSCTLVEDIPLATGTSTMSNWTPVVSFSGVFDGNGHTISNLRIRSTNDQYTRSEIALFNTLEESAVVKDLTLENARITLKFIDFGALLAYMNKGVIDNCHVIDGNVSCYDNTGSCNNGGLVGTNRGLITGCSFSGILYGRMNAGGIAVYNYGSIFGCVSDGSMEEFSSATVSHTVGGIVGDNDGTVMACMSSAGVRAGYSGGVVGSSSTDLRSLCYVGSQGAMTGGVVAISSDRDISIESCFTSTSALAGPEYRGYKAVIDDKSAYSVTGDGWADAVNSMNEAIDEWNVSNPDNLCQYRFEYDGSQQLPVIVEA